MASAGTDRTVRIDLATLAGIGLIVLALFAAVRDLSLVRLLLSMPYVGGTDALVTAPDVLTGLIAPAIGLLVLAAVLGYAVFFDRRSVALVALCTTGVLYWSGDVASAALAVVLAGVFAVLDVVSTRARTG